MPILINGLKRLEYRGYDSAGVALMEGGELNVHKKEGKVSELENMAGSISQEAKTGIGHTRWATHGEPNDKNAHPHYSANKHLAAAHNGIIENYGTIKTDLQEKGYQFRSDTDTEVLTTFVEHIKNSLKLTLEEAARIVLSKVTGAYAVVILSKDDPGKIIAAKKGSPMVIGIGKGEYYVASDATPIVEHTKNVIYLNDGELAVIEKDNLEITDVKINSKKPEIHKLELNLEAIEKGGYAHFMLKEIFEQPKSIADCMRGRVLTDGFSLTLDGINKYIDKLTSAPRIILIGCGTSWHAGLVAEYIFEELCRIPIEVEYASEFRYRRPVINKGDVVMAISQSGETADTLAAIELAKNKGAIVFGIVNAVGSSISRATHEGAYLHAGPEIGVASTKAFTAQLTVLTMMALNLAEKKQTISRAKFKELLQELESIPQKVAKVLKSDGQIKKIAALFKNSNNFLYLGRGYNFPVALEGALKLKEISYIHAEGYPAAEMKHGPIALIDENMPVVVIATRDGSYDKIVSNIQEVKSRKGTVIAIVTEGDALMPKMADFIIEVPVTNEITMPLVSVIPLQLLSYHMAIMRGCNVDQPRNLAKSVTVE